MAVRKAQRLAISAALLAPQLVSAQVASRVEAGALITDANGQSAIPSSTWRLAPAASYRGSHGSIGGATSAWIDNQNWQLVDGSIGGTLVGPTIYGVRAELIGNASRAFDERSLGSDQIDLQTRISVQFNKSSGAWLGGGVARPWRVMVVSSVDLYSGGAWIDLGSGTLTSSITNFSFTRVADAGEIGPLAACASPTIALGDGSGAAAPLASAVSGCEHRSTMTDATFTGRWNFDRVEVAGETGHRMGHLGDVTRDSRYWASATATMWVAPRAAIMLGGGKQPSNPARGLPARTFGTLGMVLAYLPASQRSVPLTPAAVLVRTFEVRPADEGMQKITVHVGGVESVDVAGDFSDWAPLTMTRRGRDLWELTVPVASGVHQITVRTDGGKWVAPPGLPTTSDPFTGEVGVLIVKH